MSKRTSGKIELDVTVLDGIHHGAGVSGNTAMLRTQDICDDEGNLARVPWVSGSSFKHLLRDAGARHAIKTLRLDDGSLPKSVVDLLFSGGHLTKSGSAVGLGKARELEALFPILMLGYSAGNTMRSSRVHIDNFHLVCSENKFRTPKYLQELPHTKKLAGAYKSEEFGTRHEASKAPYVSRLLEGDARRLLEDKNAKAVESGQKQDKGDSSQMIFEFQTIVPNSRMFSTIYFDELNRLEMGALKAALSFACQGGSDEEGYHYYLGAKRSSGWGRVAIKMIGHKDVSPSISESEAMEVCMDPQVEYERHLTSHKDEILEALKEATK